MEDNLLVIFIFIFVLIILGLMIGLIIILLPKTAVQLDQPCLHQTDCSAGLVCSAAPRGLTGSVCLKGLEQVCETNTECSTGLKCINHVCSFTGTIAPTEMINMVSTSPLQFNQNNFVTKMTPITSLSGLFSNTFTEKKKQFR